MPRAAFRLRIKPGKESEYDIAHRNVWPALLARLKEVGISNYSIFRREQDLFGAAIITVHLANIASSLRSMNRDGVLLFGAVPALVGALSLVGLWVSRRAARRTILRHVS